MVDRKDRTIVIPYRAGGFAPVAVEQPRLAGTGHHRPFALDPHAVGGDAPDAQETAAQRGHAPAAVQLGKPRDTERENPRDTERHREKTRETPRDTEREPERHREVSQINLKTIKTKASKMEIIFNFQWLSSSDLLQKFNSVLLEKRFHC